MQARYQLELSPVRGTAVFLVLAAALILAAAAGFLYRGVSAPAAAQHAATLSVPARGLPHDDSWVVDRSVPPHDQSWEGIPGA